MNPLTNKGTPRRHVARDASIKERILFRTDRSGDCWLWTAHVARDGYGRIKVGGRVLGAHRASYVAFVGAVDEGLHLDHLCRVRHCVNPFHLEPVTCAENARRGMSPGAIAQRRDLCLYGHPYAEHGWVRRINARECRVCRVCHNAYARIFKSTDPAERARRKREGLPVVDLAAHFSMERAMTRLGVSA